MPIFPRPDVATAKAPESPVLPPPPSYDETTNESLNLFEVLQVMEKVFRKHKYRTREFCSLLLGFSGLPQNHTGSAGLHKYDDLLISSLKSVTQNFEELRTDVRYFANSFISHQQGYPHSPPTSPPPHDLSAASFPEVTDPLIQQIHLLTVCIEKVYDRVHELNKRMKPVLFKRTENIFHKNFGLAKGWQMVNHIEPNIDDWVKWMNTLDARTVCLKLDLERELDDGGGMD